VAKKFLTGIDNSNQRIVNLADGSAATDAVTLQQMQAAIRGIDWKASVRAATTANITLSAAQTVDGVALAVGDRVLVKDQTTQSTNGIYVVASGAWARADDADTNTEMTSGMAVTVESGTVNADKVFILVTDGTITIGTSNLAFTQLGGGGATYGAGNGLTLSGSTFAVVPKSGGGLVVDSTGVSIDTAVVARRYAVAIGDGSATAFTVTHNLGTRDVMVMIYNATTFEQVEVDVIATSATAVTVTFASAPASGAYRVVVIG
jgi:phage-related tail fiber protein